MPLMKLVCAHAPERSWSAPTLGHTPPSNK